MLNLTLQFPLGQLLQEVLQTRLSLAAKTEPVWVCVGSSFSGKCGNRAFTDDPAQSAIELQSLHSLGVPLQWPPALAAEQTPVVESLLQIVFHCNGINNKGYLRWGPVYLTLQPPSLVQVYLVRKPQDEIWLITDYLD